MPVRDFNYLDNDTVETEKRHTLNALERGRIYLKSEKDSVLKCLGISGEEFDCLTEVAIAEKELLELPAKSAFGALQFLVQECLPNNKEFVSFLNERFSNEASFLTHAGVVHWYLFWRLNTSPFMPAFLHGELLTAFEEDALKGDLELINEMKESHYLLVKAFLIAWRSEEGDKKLKEEGKSLLAATSLLDWTEKVRLLCQNYSF